MPTALRETVDRVQEIHTVRERHDAGLQRADMVSAIVLGLGFVAIALGAAIFGGPFDLDATHMWSWVGLIALYALAHDTVFVAATGSAVPTQPILVAMLLTLPLHLVPLTMLVAVLIGGLLEQKSGALWYRIAVEATTPWHCIGPVAVLMIADVGAPSLDNSPIYLLALLAQFGVDAAVGATRTWALGVPVRSIVRPMGWTFGVDAMLAPIGLTAVIAAGASPELLMLLAAPLGLIRFLAADRSAQLEDAITLGSAIAEVSSQARVDSMTGVGNRRAWEEELEAAQLRMNAGDVQRVDVVMADLDHLKLTNDTFGHQAGDELIREAARTLVQACPPDGVVARLGGDEFGVLIFDGEPGAGMLMVTRVRQAMEQHMDLDTPFSMSLGTASCPPYDTLKYTVEVADAGSALDKASRRVGRNAELAIWSEPPAPSVVDS